MAAPVVVDVETQMTFRDVGGYYPEKLRISVAGLYDYATDLYKAFEEPELPEFFRYLENSTIIIGFNVIDFDLRALSTYYVGDLKKFPTLDLLKHVEKSLGYRISLDDLAKETLLTQKNGHGLLAIEYFRNKEMDKLKKYCLSDVDITRKLYEYGKTNKKLYFKSTAGKQDIPVSWDTAVTSVSSQVNLTLPW